LHGQDARQKFFKNSPNGAMIVYRKRDVYYNSSVVIEKAKLRTQNILLVKNKDYKNLAKKK